MLALAIYRGQCGRKGVPSPVRSGSNSWSGARVPAVAKMGLATAYLKCLITN